MANQKMNITIKAFDKTKAGLGSAAKGIKAVAGSVLSLKTALIGVAGVAGFGMMIKSSMTATDSLGKTARKIGVTTEALAKMRYAAHLTGVSTQTMDMALQRFTRRAAEAAIGTGEAKNALKELKINAQEIIKLPLEDQMAMLAKAFEDVDTEADKVRLAMKLFDSEGVALVNTLGLGEEALKEMAGEAAALGLTMSNDAVKGVEDANDAFSKLGFLFKGVRDQLTGALAPALETFADFLKTKLQTAIEESGGSVEAFAQNLAIKILDGVSGALQALQTLINGVINTFNEIKLAAADFTGFFKSDDEKNATQLQRKLDKLNESMAERQRLIDSTSAKQKRSYEAAQASEEAQAERIRGLLEQRTELGEVPLVPEVNFMDAINATFEGIKEGIRGVQEEKQLAKLQDAENTELEKDAIKEKTAFELYNQDLKAQGAVKLKEFNQKNLGDQTKDVLGNLSSQLGAYKGQSKKLFALSKAAAIGKAIINTYEGATKAMASYKPPINFAMAAAVVAGGMAQVSQIRAQSFDGGGYTGSGSRTGGVDGKGGFSAILHPNETVIDHTKGQQKEASTNQGIVVNQSFNVSAGVQGTVRAELENMMPLFVEQAQAAVLGARLKGGAYSKQLLGK
jgi:hypothetical protein